MKILLLAPHPFFQPRGTPIAVKLLVETLTAKGHRIHMITYPEGENVRIPNFRLERIRRMPWVGNIQPGPSWKKIVCDILMFFKCIEQMRKHRYDMIHAVEEAAFMALFLKAFYKVPFIYDMDSSMAQQIADKYRLPESISHLLHGAERILIRKSDGIIAVCGYLEELAKKWAPAKNILRLEDICLLDPSTQENENLRASLKIDGPIIMYVGNLEKYQGIDLLLRSIELTSRKIANVNLVLVGGSEKDIKHYGKTAMNFRIADRVHFIGPRPISLLNSLLQQADILVSPRITGGNTPMKIYSYLGSNRPLLATYLPTHTQVLDERIAMLRKPEPKAMAEGLIALLTNEKIGKKLANEAKRKVDTDFSMNAFRKKLLEFYMGFEESL